MNRIMNRSALMLISLYQKVTENMGHRCLHEPTCSEYMRIVYTEYGFVDATRRSLYRLKNCGTGVLPYEHRP